LGRGITGMAKLPYNPAYLTPHDLARLGLEPGDEVVLTSESGEVRAYAHPDATMRAGTVALVHGWGSLDPDSGPEGGTNVNLLTSGRTDLQPINRMPRFTAIPVRVRPAQEVRTASASSAPAPG
jgi:anaerobic selenocysteine-containing dehydrogenase